MTPSNTEKLETLKATLQAGTSYQKELGGWLLGEEDFDFIVEVIQQERLQAAREARIDENKSIESMLIDEINDLRTCCFNHDKFTPQCHACQKFKWRKIIAKEYLESIQDRLTTLRKEG